MEEKKKYKSLYAKVIVLTMALVVIGISSSYAYYTSAIQQNTKKTILQASNFAIDSNLDSVGSLTNIPLTLINASQKASQAKSVNFYVKSVTGATVDATYTVSLTNISISPNLCDSSLKWELVKGSTSLGSGNFSSACTKSTSKTPSKINDILLTTSAQSLLKTNTTGDSLTFRIWLENDSNKNQMDLTEGSFSGKLALEAAPVSANK